MLIIQSFITAFLMTPLLFLVAVVPSSFDLGFLATAEPIECDALSRNALHIVSASRLRAWMQSPSFLVTRQNTGALAT